MHVHVQDCFQHLLQPSCESFCDNIALPGCAGAAKVGSGKPVPAGQVGLAGQGPNKENEDESARPAASKAQPAALKPMPQPPQALNSR